MDNELRFISEVIYDLKRDYGCPIEIYQNVVGTTDFKTGEKTITKNKWKIRRAVTLPNEVKRDALYTTMLVRLFEYGNFAKLADRTILVDLKDLPKGFKMGHENWYVLIEGMRYSVTNVDEYAGRALLIGLKNLAGEPREAIVEMSVNQNIKTTPSVDRTT